ncbi:hypothetical protein MTR67_001241 [Solanum verrucosum]|uniref:Chromo domain-containing protein n=1 Tax=Solanum verrucosum TaxID=315347 RepID=A0AAF0PSF8_SOLVR|nr:hypothetical protein MTR67_001241 [Solanum verrucosum]
MARYEALYGWRYRSLFGWFEVSEAGLIDLELVHQAMEKAKVIQERSHEEIPVQILDRQVCKLRTKDVASVKVLWRNQFVEEATWEAEENMKKRYPHLFESGGNAD